MAIKPKQWLFDNGHIQSIGRGRMSRESIALIKEAVANGVDIEGYSIAKPKPTADSGDKPEAKVDKPIEVTKDKAVAGKEIADIGNPVRDEKYWQAHVIDNGKRIPVGMRTVDNLCGSSLTYCHCRAPMVNIDHDRAGMVVFSPKS